MISPLTQSPTYARVQHIYSHNRRIAMPTTTTEPATYRPTSTHMSIAIFPVPDLTSVLVHDDDDGRGDDRRITMIRLDSGRGTANARLQFHDQAEAHAWLTDTLAKLTAVAT